MSAATGTAPSGALETPRGDELELACIVCHGRVGRTEKVAYWPPSKGRPGVIAHCKCLAKGGSL